MKRALGLFDVTCLGVNAIIGSGIFALPDDIYREMGGLSPLAFVLCAVGLAPVALCYAEAASTTERTGGPYVYVREAFGAWPGFVVGWMCFANSIVSFAAVAAVASAYLGRFVPLGDVSGRAAAVLIILAFAGLNYVGAKPGARAIDFFTVGKVITLVILIGALIPSVRVTRLGAPAPHGLAGIGTGTFIALFAVQGFEVTPVPAGETIRARRNLPIAMLAALALSSIVYVIVQVVVVGAHPALARPSEAPLADAALAVAPALGVFIVAGGLVSTLGFVAGNALGTPRYAYATAADGYLPRALAAIHPRFATPHHAVAATGVIAAILTALVGYRRLIGMSNVTVAVQYLATCVAVIALRRKPTVVRGFRAPGGWVVPILGILVSAWIFTEGSRQELGFAACALVVGIAIAAATRRYAQHVALP